MASRIEMEMIGVVRIGIGAWHDGKVCAGGAMGPAPLAVMGEGGAEATRGAKG